MSSLDSLISLVGEGGEGGVVCGRIKFVNLLAKTAVSKVTSAIAAGGQPLLFVSFVSALTLPFLYSHNEKPKHQSD